MAMCITIYTHVGKQHFSSVGYFSPKTSFWYIIFCVFYGVFRVSKKHQIFLIPMQHIIPIFHREMKESRAESQGILIIIIWFFFSQMNDYLQQTCLEVLIHPELSHPPPIYDLFIFLPGFYFLNQKDAPFSGPSFGSGANGLAAFPRSPDSLKPISVALSALRQTTPKHGALPTRRTQAPGNPPHFPPFWPLPGSIHALSRRRRAEGQLCH